jgi:hypothetical protein
MARNQPCSLLREVNRWVLAPLSVYNSPWDFIVSGRGLSFRALPLQDSYLVDSASSHMLVSKIKPCMSKYKQSIR